MKDKKKKKSVSMDTYHNENGFTLVSTLLALLVIAMTLSLISPLIQTFQTQNNYEALSVQRFFSYLHEEAAKAQAWSVHEGKLTMEMHDGETATFEKNNQGIIRRLKGGYEVYLYDAEQMTLDLLPYGVRVHITTLEGKQYAKTIVFH
ncbi:hypothetical protein JNUCC1_03530 [Lentibacillus sp. JNUCC-1]|uniref:competence type IV pilus minor pilin ComGF n=1 Tax=Lentibacillus sp. JNUCC-1 TaxID=2654513 RepID=UPI00132B97D9|nr:competence type IV pilus minor pilin ComGF [Lentibacillus sp. JNUCC-1]MUV39646.1 hypothetical protein [Lentibacillus sp. JNUCC-1]